MAVGEETMSEAEAMHELAKQLWERYFKQRVSDDLLNHSLDGYKATVITNNGDGTLTVQRPFDTVSMTLRCPPALGQTAQAGDQVLVVSLGDMSNAFILCTTDLNGLGGGGGGDAEIDLLGYIAQITVDSLSTETRVKKYFLQDTTDDVYLKAENGKIQFVVGTVTSQTPVQVLNRYGESLYWEREPTGHLTDGSPIDTDGNRVYSSTTITQWPVYTYTYSETVKSEYSYSSGDAASFPNTGIHANGAGYMDLYGLRKPTRLDFSNWGLGFFEETVDGGSSHAFLVDFDTQGRPVKITDGDGHETVVVW